MITLKAIYKEFANTTAPAQPETETADLSEADASDAAPLTAAPTIRRFAVENLSLEIATGETLVLLGSSGCGKSTTLRMLLRLIEPTSGQIEIDGKPLAEIDPTEWRRSVGYVFQSGGLMPHMTVRRNMEIGLRLAGWSSDRRTPKVDEMLTLVGLSPADLSDRLPRELSGGQQQRVAVARALATDPDYLMMDEPFGALDAITRDRLQQEMIDLKQRLGKTIIIVTHDLFEALTLGDRIAILHDGQLQQVGTPNEIVNTPATPFVEELFQSPAKQLKVFQDARG